MATLVVGSSLPPAINHTSETQHKEVNMEHTPSASSTNSTTTGTGAGDPTTPNTATSTSSTATASSSNTGSTYITGPVESSHSYQGPARATQDRMIIKLTTNLMNTYNAINEKYYANKRKRLMEQQAAAALQQKKLAAYNGGQTYNEGHDDKDYNYIVQSHELFANRYVVDHSIGKGSFGRVVKAFDTITKKYVAIKIVKSKSAFYKQAQIELKILQSLQADADKWNIVNLVDQFIHKNHQCIVFELLSLNLYELLKNTRFFGVSLKLIAKFGQQLLCTLGYLGSKERGDKRIIHCDLKPENILLRNCKKSAIKVIDFGSACFAHYKTYTYIQSRFYRAPEVLLGCPYNVAIDMWSLGCILVEMHTGKPLFDGQDEADQMVKQVEILGIPPKNMLDYNKKAEKFFEMNEATGEYQLKKKFKANLGGSIKGALGAKYDDSPLYREFVDLIQQMLIYDPLKRLRPSQALAHPFFAAVAGIIANENAATSSVAAAAHGAKLQSPSGNPLGSGSGVATALAAPSVDATMATSPHGTVAMDTTTSPAAASNSSHMITAHNQQKFAYMQQQLHKQQLQQQQQHPYHHHHHHHGQRSNSRKRPHSNPVFGASMTFHQQHPLQPLDPHVQQAIMAQSMKQQKQQASHTSSAQAAAQAAAQQQQQQQQQAAATAATNVTPTTRTNNLMQDTTPPDTASSSQQPAATSITVDSNSHMEDLPDAQSTSIVPPAATTSSKHGMVTRSAAGPNKASASSSTSSSGRNTPETQPTLVVQDLDLSHARSRGNSQLVTQDASTVTTATASATSSPKAPNLQTNTNMVDIDPVVIEESSSLQDISPAKSGSKRKGKRGKKQSGGGSLQNPNASESESEGTAPSNSSVGSSQMSRMSLDLDQTTSVGHRTRSHANQ